MPSSGVQTCALDRKSTRLNSSHTIISYAVFCLKKKILPPQHRQTREEKEPHPLELLSERATRISLQENSPGGGPGLTSVSLAHTGFFFNPEATPEIHPLPLPASLPI